MTVQHMVVTHIDGNNDYIVVNYAWPLTCTGRVHAQGVRSHGEIHFLELDRIVVQGLVVAVTWPLVTRTIRHAELETHSTTNRTTR